MIFHSFRYRTARVKWWFFHRFHPKHRYHVIYTGLEPGWYDRDEMMAVLIRKMIVDFVEKENPFDHFETVNSRHAKEWQQLKELYEFFKFHDDFLAYKNETEYDAMTEKLVEAVRLRKMLWT